MANNEIKKVTININAKDYNILCEEIEFAKILEEEIKKISNNNTNKVDLKDFVNTYAKKSYDCYKIEKQLKELNKTLNFNFKR